MPKVSVIIPCYNQGHFVEEAVNSVQAQTFTDFEIIIVDDASTDARTTPFLDAYSAPKTTCLRHAVNKGLSAARNTAIKHAKGEYILPLDADDKIGPRYLEEAVKALDSTPNLGIVYCKAAFFGIQKGPWNLAPFSIPEMLRHNVIFCTGMFRKQDWETVGGYDSAMIYGLEDYDFWLSILGLEREVLCLPDTHFFYRKLQQSMSSHYNWDKHLSSYEYLFKKHLMLYAKHAHEMAKIIHPAPAPLPLFNRVVNRLMGKKEPQFQAETFPDPELYKRLKNSL